MLKSTPGESVLRGLQAKPIILANDIVSLNLLRLAPRSILLVVLDIIENDLGAAIEEPRHAHALQVQVVGRLADVPPTRTVIFHEAAPGVPIAVPAHCYQPPFIWSYR